MFKLDVEREEGRPELDSQDDMDAIADIDEDMLGEAGEKVMDYIQNLDV